MAQRTRFARTRSLTPSGNGIVSAWPKELLREEGLLDEDDEPVDDAEVLVYRDEDRGALQLEVPIE